MKQFTIMLLIDVALVACSQPAIPSAPTATITMAAPVVTATVNSSAEETEVRTLVENFGKRLQSASLLAPDAS